METNKVSNIWKKYEICGKIGSIANLQIERGKSSTLGECESDFSLEPNYSWV